MVSLDIDEIDLANTRVSIESVLRSAGVHVFDGDLSSKVHCPFERISHDDGGERPAMKIYGTNSCYCFACARAWTPVTLYAEMKDASLDQAAQVLLEGSGYVRPTADSLWDAIVAEQVTIDHDSLSEALKIYLARKFPAWEVRQFDEEIAKAFRACVDLLPRVRTTAEAEQWLTTTKRIMTTKLGDDS